MWIRFFLLYYFIFVNIPLVMGGIFISEQAFNYIERNNLDAAGLPGIDTQLLNTQMKQKKIYVTLNKSKQSAYFSQGTIYKEDLLILDFNNVFLATVTRQNTDKSFSKELMSLIPFIGYRGKGKELFSGFIESKDIVRLTIKKMDIDHPREFFQPTDTNITILYALLPRNRLSAGQLFIYHHGKWVKNEQGQPRSFSILGLCKERNLWEFSKRFLPQSDTPQGVYQIPYILYSKEKKFGYLPRLGLVPLQINRLSGHKIFDIFPKNWQESYWFHEALLATLMGRLDLRIHGSAVNCAQKLEEYYTSGKHFCRTSGCLSMGHEMDDLLETLSDIDILPKHFRQKTNNGKNFCYPISGLYLVIKDDQEPPFNPFPLWDRFALEPL